MNEWLLLAAFVAGFVDSIVGGGGAITLPALLATGMPPHLAVGTNKVVGTGASTIATLNYARAGKTDPLIWRLAPLALLASVAGALAILRIDGQWILWAVMAMMVLITVYVAWNPRFGQDGRNWRNIGWLAALAVAVGFYDGLLGPGTGNLLLFGLVALGMTKMQASTNGRVLNWASNIGALALFAALGNIDWSVGLLMAVGTVTGGWMGSQFNIKTEAKWVRPLFIAVAVALLLRLIWSAS